MSSVDEIYQKYKSRADAIMAEHEARSKAEMGKLLKIGAVALVVLALGVALTIWSVGRFAEGYVACREAGKPADVCLFK